MFTIKTNLNVTVNQYNQMFVDNLKVEFVPIYENGCLVATMFQISDTNITNTCFVKKLYLSDDFSLKTKIRGRNRTIMVGLRGSLKDDGVSEVSLVVKTVMKSGEYEYIY